MSRRGSRRVRRLVRFGGKVMTTLHAVQCGAKGFKGCTKAEKAAAIKVLGRLANSMRRR